MKVPVKLKLVKESVTGILTCATVTDALSCNNLNTATSPVLFNILQDNVYFPVLDKESCVSLHQLLLVLLACIQYSPVLLYRFVSCDWLKNSFILL